MADIRCSNCQTLNPADARVCKKCGQSLVDESIGWLDNLRGGSSSAAWEEPETSDKAEEEAQPGEEIPDWLQRIRQRNQEGQDEGQSATPAEGSSENLPDWLRDIQQGSTSSAAPAEPAGEDDWLQNLRGAESPFAAETPAASASPFSSEPADQTQDDASDWMQSLDSWKSGSDQPPEETPAEQPVDWMSRLGSDQPTGQTSASSGDDDQDWLNQFSRPAGEQATPAEGTDEDWLSGLQAAAGAGEQADSGEPEPSGEQFDWMSGLGTQAGSNEPSQGPFDNGETPAAGPGVFSWENELPADEPGSASGGFLNENESSAGEPEASQPDETPDWLRKFDQTPAGETQIEQPLDSESAQPSGELPDWLSSFSPQEPEKSAAGMEASADEGQTEPVESVPEWLSNFTPGEAPAKPVEPVIPISDNPQEESFSWQSLGIPGEPAAATEEPAEPTPFAGANLPEWLDQNKTGEPRLPYDQELIPPATPAGEMDERVPFVPSSMPDWLDESGQTAPAAEAASEELPAEGGEPSLEAAELPSWLQSMRPIEMVAPKRVSAEEKRVEKAGPLAGLSGVLPTEDLVGQYIKPPLYSVKLRVSEKQRVHASLIESLISEETQPQSIPAERSEAPKRLLRFLVAAVLILAVLLPMLNFLPAFPSNMLPQELIDFQRILSDETVIPQGSAVLLAVEYEPGLSGEMQTASEAVVRQLAERGVSLTVISTSPTGAILAESLFDQAGFDLGRVVNLGYLSGGSTGLQSFALSPVQAAPATLQGKIAPWNGGLLEGVSNLSDFAATIVLTDDPDKGRTWIEQVQPALADKPLLMVSSAQAAPLLLPYYNSGQVKGIVSGISGAAGFESLAESSGTATLLRGSFQYGMLLAALLILIGGLVTGIISSISRGKAEKEA